MTPGTRALLAVLLVLGPLLGLGPATPSAAAHQGSAQQADPALRLDVIALGPAVLRPDDTITVRATLHNDGTAAASDLLVRLQAYSVRLPSREAVAAWADNTFGIRAGNRPLAETQVDALAPGASTPIAFDAPASALNLSGAAVAWGPRGLTLEVLDDGFAQLAVARAFTVWDPRPPEASTQESATSLSMLVPVTAGPPDVGTGLVTSDALEDLTAQDGRLSRVLRAASAPEVAWAVDPAVLQAAAATGDEAVPGTPEEQVPEAAGPASRAWLDALREAAAERVVLTLPQSDPDLVGLAHAGAEDLYEIATREGRQALVDLLDARSVRDAAWPGAGAADEAALSLAAQAGASTIVLSAGAQRPVEESVAVLSGRSSVQVGDERLDGLLVDTPLSTTLASATQGESTALGTSRLLAETAAITRGAESPPHLLVALPRHWDPRDRPATTTLGALSSVPWLTSAPLDDLLQRAPDDVERAPVRLTAPDRAAELPTDGLKTAAGALTAVRRVSGALTRPEPVLDAMERSSVAATGLAWLDDAQGWRTALDTLQAQARSVTSAVRVLEGSSVNVVSAQADLPVTLANDLAQDVNAVVSVQPRSPRLVSQGDVEVRVAASSTQRVALPVRALANGDTEVVVAVQSPDGALLGEPVTVSVRVRADWETRGMLVTGAVLAAVLVVGLARNIRRGGRRDTPAGKGI